MIVMVLIASACLDCFSYGQKQSVSLVNGLLYASSDLRSIIFAHLNQDNPPIRSPYHSWDPAGQRLVQLSTQSIANLRLATHTNAHAINNIKSKNIMYISLPLAVTHQALSIFILAVWSEMVE